MKFKSLLVLVFCILANLSLAKKLKGKALVRDADRLTDVMSLLMVRDESMKIDKRSASRYANKHICTFPEDPNIVTEDNNKLVEGVQAKCQPRLVAVPINIPIHHVTWPTYVTLHRCIGGYYSRLQQCVASKKERILVKYFELISYKYENATMYNHTDCTSNCIFKPEDCNPQTETFRNCHCQCNFDSSHCNSTWQTFNGHSCNCDCKHVQQCNIKMEWNPVTCQCHCLKCLRDLCTKANLQINEETCQCSGQVVSRRSSSILSLFTNKKSALSSYKKH